MLADMLSFNRWYFFWTILLFCVEIFIALFVRDRLIRPYGGDVLVVILIYCFVMSFFAAPVLPVALAVLVFAFAVEFLQYFQLIDWLGWGDSKVAAVVLGNSFAGEDLVAYVLGIVVVIITERLFRNGQKDAGRKATRRRQSEK